MLVVAGLADSAGKHYGIATTDPQVAARVVKARSPSLTAIAQTLTWIGCEVVVGTIALLVLVVLLLRRRWFRGAVAALVMGGSAFSPSR